MRARSEERDSFPPKGCRPQRRGLIQNRERFLETPRLHFQLRKLTKYCREGGKLDPVLSQISISTRRRLTTPLPKFAPSQVTFRQHTTALRRSGRAPVE